MRTDFDHDNNQTTFAVHSFAETDQKASESDESLRAGIKAAQSGDRASARSALLRAAELDPRNENAWLWLSSISEYPEELLAFLNNVLEINPNNERALEWAAATRSLIAKNFLHRGIDAAETGDKETALCLFKQALEHDTMDVTAWLWMASLAEVDAEKTSHLEHALEIDPNNEQAKEELKRIKARKQTELLGEAKRAALFGNIGQAIDVLSDLLAEQPNSVDAWMLLAHVSSDIEEKIRAFEKVLELDEENAAALHSLESLRSIVSGFDVLEGGGVRSEVGGQRGDEGDSSVLEANFEVDEGREVPSNEPPSWMSEPAEVSDDEVINFEVDGSSSLMEEAYCNKFEHSEPQSETNEYEESRPPDSCIDEVPNDGSYFDGGSSYADLYVPEQDTIQLAADAIVFDPVEGNPVEFQDPIEVDLGSKDERTVIDATHDDGFKENILISEHSGDDSEIVSYDGEQVQSDSIFGQAGADAYEPPPTLVSIEIDEETRSAIENYAPAGYSSEEHHDDSSPSLSDANPSIGDTSMMGSEIVDDHEPEDPWQLSSPDELNSETNLMQIADASKCPYCSLEREPQAVACEGCFAVLTLSDLELLIANQQADKNTIRKAVESMESELVRREFSEAELTILGIGHLNLRNLQYGYDRLYEASQLNPNNVVLAAQVNALLIRLEEIKRQEEAHSSMVTGKTIMVVDDSPTVRKLIAGKLEKCGHEVHCSSDGEEAIEQLESIRPDLVLLDIAMPKLDGYQVCKMIRNNNATKDIPVVMISGKDGFFDKVRGRMAGTSGYITKPFGPETLMKTVDSYLRGSGETS